ncbi:oligopeptide ABC transporter substrate-binding protein OppA [Mycoplasma mycoides]|uniref:oligopeptide ABC transporter substrate-binding protein OppA n=1 Tax=Mycoplasma mycoides TaxID=2102 RepID=UPI0005410E27|nr:oligopeptide ABC transporter substrate-binding protein OppA [Mycoplasma mycoides]AIZ55034.1 ABC-type oligopeptide transport system, periplasmic component [Mycoplasma mycoides subsp. mycoides]PTD34176.1 Oligopeptide ABC transporter, substrate-binding protein [Mycoplasma mycoides subsp. mycoides PO-67]
MKKVLGMTLLGSIIATAAASAVSCSVRISLDKILNRKNSNTKVLRELTNYSLANLNSATNNTSNDADIIANLQDVLLTVNRHDHYEGALAEYWDHNSNKDYWKFRLRKNAYWTKIENGKQVKGDLITGLDIFNTFRYVLNKNNLALTTEHFLTNFKHAPQLMDFINKLSDPTYDKSNGQAKAHSLYDSRFNKDLPGDLRTNELSSSYWIDRAILAFNIKPDNEQEAKNLALNASMSTKDLVKKSFAEGKIVNDGKSSTNDDKSQDGLDQSIFDIGFYLSKKISYFESVISYLAFAPIPEIALFYANDKDQVSNIYAGTNYGKPLGKKSGYNGLWYSGPYVIEDYFPGSNLNLTRNEFYYNKENVYIEKINYSYVNKADAATRRFLFETGDVSSTKINANDLAGWQKYVGKDEENPVFSGTNVLKQKPTTTWAFGFNFHTEGTQIYDNIQLNSEGSLVETGKKRTRTPEEDSILNRALALKSVRILARYALNRSLYAKFYSEARDGVDRPTSTQLRNTFTSKYVSTFEDKSHQVLDKDLKETVADYADFLAKDYYDIRKYDDNNNPKNNSSSSSSTSTTRSRRDVSSTSSSASNAEEKSWSDWIIDVLKKKQLHKPENIKNWGNRFGKVNDSKHPNSKTKVSVYNEGNDAFLENDLLAFTAFLEEDQLQPINGGSGNGKGNGLFNLNRDPKTVKFKNESLAKEFANLIGVYDKGYNPKIDTKKQDSVLQNLYKKINLLKRQVKEDLEKIAGIKNYNKPITIPFLLNPTGADDFKIKVAQFFGSFNYLVRKHDSNDIDSPIVFDIDKPIDFSNYLKELRAGKYGLAAFGWSPDYDDPTNYLATLKYDGVYEHIQSWTKVFNKSKLTSSNGANGQKREKDIKLELKDNDKTVTKEVLEKAYSDLKNILQHFTNELTYIDENEADIYKRYTQLAKLENYYTLSSAIIIPTHTHLADTLPSISYVDEFSKPTWPTGSHAKRYVGVRIFYKIVTKEDFAKQQKEYEQEKTSGYKSLNPMKFDDKTGKNIYFDHFKGDWRTQWKDQYNKEKKAK